MFPVSNVWHISNGVRGLTQTQVGASSKQGAVAELLARHLRLSTYMVVTLCTYAFCFPLERAKVLKLDWILVVLMRNLMVELLFYGGWHVYLYGDPFALTLQGVGSSEFMKTRKFNKKDQYALPSRHLVREVVFTTLGFVMSTAYEVAVMHLWMSGRLPYLKSFWATPLYSVFHVLLVGYWRDFHFFFVHRLMHPWGVSLPLVGDIGQMLYTHVHALHHKSYNPGPFSGLSMHPVEHLLYYTCTLLVLVTPLHPIHFLFNKFHADLSPLPGHDGFDQPGGGSFFHYLHHSRYDCNYGTPMVPLDKLFGTYEDGSRWENKK